VRQASFQSDSEIINQTQITHTLTHTQATSHGYTSGKCKGHSSTVSNIHNLNFDYIFKDL